MWGYFDNNFGDDYMMKIIVHNLADVEFIVPKNENVSELVLNAPNVSVAEDDGTDYPILSVVGSGFMANSSAAVMAELKMFLKRKKTPDYCLGCNIEPIKSRLGRFLIRRKIRKHKLIVCRDKKSYQWLLKNNRKSLIYYLPDILFGMPQEWLPETGKDNKLGIALMHRQGDKPDCEYYRKMAEAADFWINKTGRNVVLMAFDSGCEDDVFACECVRNLSQHPEKTEIAIHRKGNEIFDAYSGCEKIIGARFHSAVLAIRMGIPFYPIVFREKMKNMLEDVGYTLKGCPIDECSIGAVKEFLVADGVGFTLPENIKNDASKYAKVFRSFVMDENQLYISKEGAKSWKRQ